MDFFDPPANRLRQKRAVISQHEPVPISPGVPLSPPPPGSKLAVRVVVLNGQDPGEDLGDGRGNGPAVALLVQGSGWLESVPTPLLLTAPSLLLLPPAARRQIRFESGAGGVLVALESGFAHWLSAREPTFVALFNEPRALALERCGAELRRLESTLTALTEELELSAAARVTAVEAHLQLLLTEALRLLEQAPRSSAAAEIGSLVKRSSELVGEFLRLAAAHSHERWRLPEYARALNVSTGHLRAACVRVTGSSPIQLIHECLIREAKRRLVGTTAPVSAIALELGFEDAGYFSRLFHAKSGLSPTQYRLAFR